MKVPDTMQDVRYQRQALFIRKQIVDRQTDTGACPKGAFAPENKRIVDNAANNFYNVPNSRGKRIA